MPDLTSTARTARHVGVGVAVVRVAPVLKVVQVSRDTLKEVRNLRVGTKKKGLNFSSNDVKWHPQHCERLPLPPWHDFARDDAEHSLPLLSTHSSQGHVCKWSH